MVPIILLLAVSASSHALAVRSGGCSVSVNGDLSDPQPLILESGSGDVRYVDPIDTAGTLSFAAGASVRLACTGTNNYLVNVGSNNVQDTEAFCVGDKTFSINSVEYEFSDLVCSFLPWHTARYTGETCLGKYTQAEIGYDLGTEFLRTLEICRDDDTYTTYYSKFNLTKGIGGYQRSYPRPSWLQGEFYPRYDISSRYTRATQIATIGTILNSEELGAKYVHTNSDFYFARGHLTAKADFVYGTAHRSTFWYLNSAPQWQTWNGANWMYLESDVRGFASSAQLDLDVYTGVHGITTLPDVNNVEQPLYFYVDDEEKGLPIPLFFWKVIYDPISQKGTAFVGVNNPYITNLTKEYFICEDISSQISWLSWTPDDVVQGISYACAVDDLRAIVETVPELVVKGILA